MEHVIYRSSEGNRYYRHDGETWEVMEPDGSWRVLKGKTHVQRIGGRMHLVRDDRGQHRWAVEVCKV
jgi:beta-galactosidase GanA